MVEVAAWTLTVSVALSGMGLKPRSLAAAFAWSKLSPEAAKICSASGALDPAFERRMLGRRVLADDVEHGDGVGVLDDRPAVGGGRGFVDDQHARGAAPRGLLVLVGPAAVIGHRLAAEIAVTAFEIGVVDKLDQQLAFDVEPLEIVPVALGRADPIADEDERSVGEVDGGLAVGRRANRDEIALRQVEALAVAKVEGEPRRADDVRLEQGHGLRPLPPAIDQVAARLEPGLAELTDDIIDRFGLGAGGGSAAFEAVGAQGLHVARQPGRVEGAGRRRGERSSGQSDCSRGEPARFAQWLSPMSAMGCGADSQWAAGCEVSRKVIQGPKQERDPMAKILCVLYDDPIDGYPTKYPRDDLPRLDRYPDGQTLPTPSAIDFQPGQLLGSVSGELGLRKFLEAAGHQLVVTEDKDGPNSEFERELVDADVVISQPFWPAYLTAERIAKAKNLKLAITAGIGSDHVDLACRDRSRDHGRRGHLLQLDQCRRARRDDDPVAGPQLSAIVGPGEGRRLEHRRLRIAILRCRGDACRDRRRRADRKRGAAPPQAVRHAPALYRSPPASARGRAGAWA